MGPSFEVDKEAHPSIERMAPFPANVFLFFFFPFFLFSLSFSCSPLSQTSRKALEKSLRWFVVVEYELVVQGVKWITVETPWTWMAMALIQLGFVLWFMAYFGGSLMGWLGWQVFSLFHPFGLLAEKDLRVLALVWLFILVALWQRPLGLKRTLENGRLKDWTETSASFDQKADIFYFHARGYTRIRLYQYMFAQTIGKCNLVKKTDFYCQVNRLEKFTEDELTFFLSLFIHSLRTVFWEHGAFN